MSQNIYLRSVHKRWQQALAKSQVRAVICSPYLTPKIAFSVAQASSPERCEIYTRFSLEDFASGASSLQVVGSFVERGYRVFEIKALHAKILLASGEFVSIGSQNLTARGVRNREATYCSEDTAEVELVEEMLRPWIDDATPITVEMVAEALQVLGPIEKEFRRLQRAAASAEAKIRAAQAMRDERTRLAQVVRDVAVRLEAERRFEADRVRRAIAYTAKNIIERSAPEGDVSLDLAKAFIRRSTWWHSHSSGSPVQASGFANRITGHSGDWRVKFGANSFLVGRAISKCNEILRQYIDGFEAGSAIKPSLMVGLLRMAISSSVAGYDGMGLGRYPITGDDMMFGTMSIDVKFFIRELLERLPEEIAGPLKEVNDGK